MQKYASVNQGSGGHVRREKNWKSGQAGLCLLELAENERQKYGTLKCLHLAPVTGAEEEHSSHLQLNTLQFNTLI